MYLVFFTIGAFSVGSGFYQIAQLVDQGYCMGAVYIQGPLLPSIQTTRLTFDEVVSRKEFQYGTFLFYIGVMFETLVYLLKLYLLIRSVRNTGSLQAGVKL
jgi:hypothetical protein